MSERYPVERMPVVFDACRRVLDREMKPVHYVELTGLALDLIGRPRGSVHWSKQIEDVREKLAQAGQLGIVYVGAPHCLALLREWVPSTQTDLFPPNQYTIGVTVRAAVRASVEAQLRAPYMKKKTNAPDARVAHARARGFLRQEALRDWFHDHFPSFYKPPPNEGKPQQGSPVDFFLRLPGGRVLRIDVAGATLRGEFSLPEDKQLVDFHLLVTDDDVDSVIWVGVVTGRSASAKTLLRGAITPQRLVCWLKCLRDDLPHGEIMALAQQRAEAQAAKPVRWRS